MYYECIKCKHKFTLWYYSKIEKWGNSRKWGYYYKCKLCWNATEKKYMKKYKTVTKTFFVLVE